MRRPWLGLLTPLPIILGAILFHFAPKPPPEPSSVVMVSDSRGGHGTGVHIGNGYILTAQHVVESDPTVTIKTERGAISTATVIWALPDYDIALVQSKTLRAAASRLACRHPIDGEPIEARGNPFDLINFSQWGRVGGASLELTPRKIATPLAIALSPGMSGGAIFDSSREVIGISHAIITGSDISFMIPSEVICRALAMEVR